MEKRSVRSKSNPSVKQMNDSNNKIHVTLKTLMQMKSERDSVVFTLYQLAKYLNMPHSILARLTHPQPSKRVKNPRVDTLFKIVEFFKLDGFNITVNDLLIGLEEKSEIKIRDQQLPTFLTEVELPLYSFSAVDQTQIGNIQIKLANMTGNTIALLSEKAIKPLFKKGSIFIIDTKTNPKDDSLVAVKTENNKNILIRKLYIDKDKKLLKSYDNNTSPVILNPRIHSIIGVVIHVNAKT